jgi:hypothetical protein
MISIIICISDLAKLIDIQNNISTTIGVEFELVVIDNSRSQYNIFQAYNIGVKRSQYPIICFMHDDIVYHSNNWGQEVTKYFNSPNTGMLGVGGTRFLSCVPTIWWAGGHKYLNSKSGTVCQNSIDSDRNNPVNRKYNIINPEKRSCTKVAILDGLWFCIRKGLFEKISFDEKSYSGFHFYDLDICMQVNRLKYDIFCIFNIQIEHISSSTHDKKWVENCNVFYHKWKSDLPVSFVKLSSLQLFHIEYTALKIIRNIYTKNKLKFSFFGLLNNITLSNLISFHLKTMINQLIQQGEAERVNNE